MPYIFSFLAGWFLSNAVINVTFKRHGSAFFGLVVSFVFVCLAIWSA